MDPEPDGSLVSRTTGVSLRMEGDRSRMIETATGKPFLRIEEMDAELDAAREEVDRLRREVEKLSKT